MKKLLVIDNYDSFTHNLVQMFMRYAIDIKVYRNDQITIAQAIELNPHYLLVSPGPKDPRNAGISMPMIRHFAGRIPVLGVCLGMQCINEVMGGQTIRAPLPVHGKKCHVFHNCRGIFKNLPSPFTAARYHSLMVGAAPCALEITAWTADNLIMGLSHTEYGVFGVQFHPESFMTESGRALIENFLSYGALAPDFRCSAA